MFSPNVSNAPANPPAAPTPAPPTCSLSAFKINCCAFACCPVSDKTLICSFCSSVKDTPTRLNADKPISGSSNALPNCNAAVFILPKPTAAKSCDNLSTSLNVSPLIDLNVNNTPAASLAPCTLASVFLPMLTAKASKSSAVCLDAPPVAFNNASNLSNCDSALEPADINLPIATPIAVKPAKNTSVNGFTLPMIAPIDDILPATGPSGPCTAAIAPAVLRKLS